MTTALVIVAVIFLLIIGWFAWCYFNPPKGVGKGWGDTSFKRKDTDKQP